MINGAVGRDWTEIRAVSPPSSCGVLVRLLLLFNEEEERALLQSGLVLGLM
jgi:hypothetical protein